MSFPATPPARPATAEAAASVPDIAHDSPWLKASWQYWILGTGVRPGPWWMQWVWTFVLAAVLALAFTLAGFMMNSHRSAQWRDPGEWAYWIGTNLTITLTISVLIHALFAVLNPRVRNPRLAGWSAWQVSSYHAGVPLLGVLIGWPLGASMVQGKAAQMFSWASSPTAMSVMLALSLCVSLFIHQWFWIKSRQILAEREAAEAQLRLLQGQMEPHFLFNTLANVHSLLDVDVPRARAMLESFTDYLRSSLHGLRLTEHSLADELALVKAYLAVQAIRMEGRLATSIDVPADLLNQPVPTLSLQPLVENAVLHGIEPSLHGGELRVSARRDGGVLRLTVEDTGVGIQGQPSRGLGQALGNVRERMARLHGPLASVTLQALEPHGARATLVLPVRSHAEA